MEARREVGLCVYFLENKICLMQRNCDCIGNAEDTPIYPFAALLNGASQISFLEWSCRQ
jgi:hypothetical protein